MKTAPGQPAALPANTWAGFPSQALYEQHLKQSALHAERMGLAWKRILNIPAPVEPAQ